MQEVSRGAHVISSRFAGRSRKESIDVAAGWYNYVVLRDDTERAPGDDGAPTVKIPAGEFWMRSETGPKEEVPRHLVYLDSYYLDKFEVTNRRYERFRVSTGRGRNFLQSHHWDKKLDEPDKPVVAVTWYDAADYCRWAGKRMPTEAEWERAARGIDERIFPWGNDFDSAFMKWLQGPSTVSVGSRPRDVTPEKVFDLGGNVSEWVADGYFLYEKQRQRNPQVPQDVDKPRVIRGGSYDHWDSINYRSARRDGEPPKLFDHRTGFRCAKSAKSLQPARAMISMQKTAEGGAR